MTDSDSVDVESKIIELVRGRPFLYDKKHNEYKDRMTSINGWTFIGDVLNLSGDSCQKIWESIRKQYTNYLKKLVHKTGAASTADPFFRHKDAMEFYKSHYRPHKGLTVSNFAPPAATTIDGDKEEEEEGEEEQQINHTILFSTEELDPYLTISQSKEKDNDEDSMSYASTSTSSKSSTGKKRKKNDNFEMEFLSLYKSSLQEDKKDEFDNFGNIIAAKLRALNKSSKDSVFDAQLEMLNIVKKYTQG